MILSGAQSGLAGAHMLSKAAGTAPVSIADIAPYAAFGAFYFLISAVWLTVSGARRRATAIAA
jgi:putative Ca2+/H+ antiporter (TMEM165/GDT1 family)